MGRRLLPVLRTTVLVYAGLLLVMLALQRHFIYFPGRVAEGDLLERARAQGLEPWRDQDGAIIGWRSPATGGAPARNAVVVFHGNAGHALDRTYFSDGFASLPDADDWQVYLFEYPGYGARGGRPSEGVIKEAAEQAVALLRRDGRRLVLIGESLGGGVASHLAGRQPEAIAGLLLITPFTSLADVGRHHYPILPVRLLLRERYDNTRALQDYRGPVAFLLAGRDEVIPTRLGQRLHDGYAGPRKLIVQPDRTHNTLSYRADADWWQEVAAFLGGSDR
jgi:uncharacterized protein